MPFCWFWDEAKKNSIFLIDSNLNTLILNRKTKRLAHDSSLK